MATRSAALLATVALGVAQSRDAFDCPMRNLALEYAAFIQPFRSAQVFQDLADALNGTPEKAPNCTVDPSSVLERVPHRSRFVQAPLPTAGSQIYADPVNGNDSNPGTIGAPVLTLAAAIALARASEGYDTIILRSGTFYQSETLVLGPQDTGLSFQSYPGETVWISGGRPLAAGVTWEPYNVSQSASAWTVAQNQNAIFGDVPSPQVVLNGTYSSWQECESACQSSYASGNPTTVWTWHDANQGSYALQCYFRLDGQWSLTGETGHVSGRLAPAPNVWKADLSGLNVAGVPGLRWNGKRMIRARYPNSDPEFGFGAAFDAQGWTAQQTARTPDIQIDLPTPVRNTSVSMFQTFTAGIGGTCDRFQPAAGYWCSENVEGGGAQIYFAPIAMQATTAQLPNMPYKNATGAIIQTWRPGHWASWAAEVASVDFDNATGVANFTVSKGFFQGSRGADTGDEVYMENVFEELDYPAEWYFDEVAQTLYLWHNATAGTPPPIDGSVVITQVKNLFNITGTQETPVTDVSFVGIGFRDTAYTYMDPHSIPSGGDWTLARAAAIVFEGTERSLVSGCVFERVDGSAILLSAYNRDATVQYNEFVWIGESCIASWGNTDGGDARLPEGYGQNGTAGNQPRGNYIFGNLAHEIGVWEKQSSFYTQFKTGRNTVKNNIVYNGPRAHVNFNDGFLGGSTIEGNLLMNSCRESADHGPFNSWDRDPYIFDSSVDGTPTTVKDVDRIDGNFIIANYNSLGALDNDDGSSYYEASGNFFVYGGGGLKNDFEGHDNVHSNNIYAWVNIGISNGYGGAVGTPCPSGDGNCYLEGHQPQFFANRVILNADGDYAKPVCSGTGKTVLYNNTVYSPTGAITECGQTLAKWQAAGNDPNTVGVPYPAAAAIIGWAREALWN